MLPYQTVARPAFSSRGTNRLISTTEISQIYRVQWFINAVTCFFPGKDLFSFTLTGPICGSAVIKKPGDLAPSPRFEGER